jgi:hypothetical protein
MRTREIQRSRIFRLRFGRRWRTGSRGSNWMWGLLGQMTSLDRARQTLDGVLISFLAVDFNPVDLSFRSATFGWSRVIPIEWNGMKIDTRKVQMCFVSLSHSHKVSPIVRIPSEQVMDFWFVLGDRPRMSLDGVNHNDVGEIILRVVYLNWRQVKEGVSVGMEKHISTHIKPSFQTTFNGRYLYRSIFL